MRQKQIQDIMIEKGMKASASTLNEESPQPDNMMESAMTAL